ncbi:MAG: hypothetical protein M3083_23700 [Actinomycetota bacterium]|nr:hypothetical protein [Actinomycetota bacterium]
MRISVGGTGLFGLLSLGATVVVIGAVFYVLAEMMRARQRRHPVGPAARHALRAAVLPAGAGLVVLAAVGAAVVLLVFLVFYLVVAAIVAAFSGNPHGLGSVIATLAIALFLTTALGAAALALTGTALVRTWRLKRRDGPGPRPVGSPRRPNR